MAAKHLGTVPVRAWFQILFATRCETCAQYIDFPNTKQPENGPQTGTSASGDNFGLWFTASSASSRSKGRAETANRIQYPEPE